MSHRGYASYSGAWREVRTTGVRPRGRYGHVLLPVAPDRVLLFAGETAGGIVNDAWVLSGASSAVSAAVPTVTAWHQLETEGPALSARKGHAAASARCPLRSVGDACCCVNTLACNGTDGLQVASALSS